MPLAAVTSVKRSDAGAVDRRQIVAEQTTFQRQRVRRRRNGRALDRLALRQHAPLREVHVEIAVIVVVEKRDAARQHLGEIELARHAVEVGEGETGLGRAIDEPVARRTRGGALRIPAAARSCRSDRDDGSNVSVGCPHRRQWRPRTVRSACHRRCTLMPGLPCPYLPPAATSPSPAPSGCRR